MTTERLIKHNPIFLSDAEIERAFVVREGELEILADLVRGNDGEVNQHALVIGPRGMGKTLLLHRLALLVRSDPDLSASWYPILAPEEIYDAATEGEIWLAILRSLADQQRQEDGEFDRWDQRYEALVGEMNEARLRAQTLGALTEFSEERGRRLLVLIENLQMLLGEQFAKDADWDLRKTLLNRPEIMVVLTATTRFEKILESSFAAYELFRELELEPLGTDDCRRLWEAVSGQDLEDLRIRPMEILTGGNPRLLAVLATFAPGRPLQELLEHLAELIDEHTPFLKSNIDALPPQERRVFVTLAKLWEPSTARRVGERCRLTSNTASAVLKSLVNRGAVVESGKVGRGKLYQVAERIYCIYYLMRLAGSEADRMRAFVRFMVPLYGEDRLARSLAEAACASVAEDRYRYIEGYRELVGEYLAEGNRRHVLEATPGAFFELPEVQDFLRVGEIRSPGAAMEPGHVAEGGTALDESPGESLAPVRQALDLLASGPIQAAIDACDDVVRCYADAKEPSLLAHVAWALFNKGVALVELGRLEEAVESYAEVAGLWSGAEEPSLLRLVARALVNKGGALVDLGRSEEALGSYAEVVERFSAADEPDLLEPVARALLHKADALEALGRFEEALETYEEVLGRFSEVEEPSLLRRVASALNGKAWLIYTSGVGSLEEAIEASERSASIVSGDVHCRHTLASVYGLAGRWGEAYEQIAVLADDGHFVENHPDELLDLLIDAAADGQVERVLEVMSDTPAEQAMEPLVVALKGLAGQPYRVPQEIEEVKEDVLVRIEKRRHEMADLRARLRTRGAGSE